MHRDVLLAVQLRGLRLPDLAKETLELHNLLEHVALLLEELESLHSEYVALQAVGASTKTTLIMLSLDDHLDHAALDIDQNRCGARLGGAETLKM